MAGTEFSSERPKGNAWGIEDAVAEAVAEFMKTGRSPVIPVIGVLSIKTVKVNAGEDGPVQVPVVAIKRINSLTDDESIRAGQKLILKAIQDLEGPRGVQTLPFDEREAIISAFGSLDADELDQDDRELAEDHGMTDPDRLRHHLTSVHGVPSGEVGEMEMYDVQRTHQSLHDPLGDTFMPHDVEWWEWRRIILSERASELGWTEAESSGPAADLGADASQTHRAHLIQVHGFDPDSIAGEIFPELEHRHIADHREPPESGFPAHDVTWMGSGRDELDAAEASAEDDTAAEQSADEE